MKLDLYKLNAAHCPPLAGAGCSNW